MAKLILFVVLLAAVAVSAQYYESKGYGQYEHKKAESYQNYHLEVGHQVPIKVPVYYKEASYEPKYESKYEPKYEPKYESKYY